MCPLQVEQPGNTEGGLRGPGRGRSSPRGDQLLAPAEPGCHVPVLACGSAANALPCACPAPARLRGAVGGRQGAHGLGHTDVSRVGPGGVAGACQREVLGLRAGSSEELEQEERREVTVCGALRASGPGGLRHGVHLESQGLQGEGAVREGL